MEKGAKVTVVLAGNPDHCTEEAKEQIRIFQAIGGTVEREIPQESYTAVFDALFGIGLSRKVEGRYAGILERMNEMGMIIDVSHLSDGGVYDCIRQSSVPIVASHSNARALCPHPRNLTDEMLHALGEKGGVVGVNFYSPFLKERGGADISDIARHAAYMTDKAGEDAVALGSDLDGFDKDDLPDGINGIQDMGGLWAAFEKADITPRQIEKIMYKNAMRVLGEVLK